MTRRTIRFAAVIALLAPTAGAQTFGKQGDFAFGAERVFGVIHTSMTTQQNNVPDVDDSSTEIALFGQGQTRPAEGAARYEPRAYSTPRIAVDYLVIDGLSIGGALIYAHVTNETKSQGVSAESSVSTFGISPRVGYAYMFSDVAGIWPRGGFTYYNVSADYPSNTSASQNGFAFSLEVPFILSPVEHVAFLIGPALDLGVTGGWKTEGRAPFGIRASADGDQTATSIALYAGMMGWI